MYTQKGTVWYLISNLVDIPFKYKAQSQDVLVLESEMVINKHVTEVVRNGCVNHQAKRVNSKAILQLIATYLAALIICIIKQTNTNITNQTNKLNK